VLIDPYVTDKLRELDVERARHAPPRPAPRPVLSPLARAAGRVLRRVGESLESWASPAMPESDPARLLAAGQMAGSPLRSKEEGC
jgi:hypothetical protein